MRQRLGTFVATTTAADLEVLTGAVASGAVRPVVDHTAPLAEAPAALRRLLDGRVAGKVALLVWVPATDRGAGRSQPGRRPTAQRSALASR